MTMRNWEQNIVSQYKTDMLFLMNGYQQFDVNKQSNALKQALREVAMEKEADTKLYPRINGNKDAKQGNWR